MNEKQWGHGYYKGVEDVLKSGTPIANKPIHIIQNGKILNQGVIIGVNEGGDYLIQRFSFIDGGQTDIIIISKSDMSDTDKIRIYADDYQWHKTFYNQMQNESNGEYEAA